MRNMIYTRRRAALLATGALIATLAVSAPTTANAADTPEERAKALLVQMTLEEKVDMLTGEQNNMYGFYNEGIPRLGIPALTAADGPAGVRINNPAVNDRKSIALPAPVALAATFDTAAATTFGDVIGEIAHKTNHNASLGTAVDIARHPQAGRAFEGYGEDPLLQGKIAASQITAIQAHSVMANIKHYNVYNQENDRLTGGNAIIGERALQEIYTRPFAIGIREADPATAMCSFNKVNGVYACSSSELLTEILRVQLGFTGWVMSDYGATQSAESIEAGLDQEQPAFGHFDWLVTAVQEGKIAESVVDLAALRVLTTMFKYGAFDNPPVIAPYDIEARALDSQRIAEAGTVLLKNEGGVLPLNAGDLTKVAVIGGDADTNIAGAGSSLVNPTSVITAVQGLRDALPGAEVEHVKGGDHVTSSSLLPGTDAIPSDYLTAADGTPGADLTVKNPSGDVIMTTKTQDITYNGGFLYYDGLNAQAPELPKLPPRGVGTLEYTATLTPEVSGTYELFIGARGDATVTLDGNEVVSTTAEGWEANTASVDLVGGQEYALRVVHTSNEPPAGDIGAQLKLGWTKPAGAVDPQAQDAAALAAESDVAVVVVRDYSTEGSDKPDLGLPTGQEALINAVKAANPNTIVVLNTGGPTVMTEWEDGVPAILQAWYGGQNQGAALARLLLGEVTPSGKLPVTFPTAADRTPVSTPEQYPGIGLDSYYTEGVFVGYRGYEEFDIAPAYPFGYGLSYTTFEYSDLKLKSTGKATVTATFTVTNTGDRAGAEAAQVYAGELPTDVVNTAPKQLAAFTKVSLEPGESETVTVELDRGSLSYWDSYTDSWVTPRGDVQVMVGSSSTDIRLDGTVSVKSSDKENRSGVSKKATYAIVNEGSGACLDAADWGTTPGTPVQQWECPNPLPNAEWTVTAAKGGSDAYVITNVNAGLVLQVAGASDAGGAQLELGKAAKKDASQQFELVRVGDGNYQLVNQNSGLCVAVDDGSRANGAAIIQQSCDADNAGQSFALKVQTG